MKNVFISRLEILIFNAKVAKTKELRETNGPLSMVWTKGRIQEVAMSVGGLVELKL